MEPAGRVEPRRAMPLQVVSGSLERRDALQLPGIVISWLPQQESQPQPDPVSFND